MVFLVEHQASVGGKGKQSFGGFHVLYLCVVELAGELPILQDRCGKDEEQQHQSKYAHVPQREPMADVVISQHLRFVFPQNEPHPAHGVQQLLLEVAIQLAP